MPRSEAWTRRLAAWFLCLLILAPAARAQETEPPAEPTAEPTAAEEPGALERAFSSLDGWFGANVVGPIQSVLFYDLWLFDDTLSGEATLAPAYDARKLDARLQELEAGGVADAWGRLIGEQLDRRAEAGAEAPAPLAVRRAIAADPSGTTFATERIAPTAALVPRPAEPVALAVGGVQLEIRSEADGLVARATGGRVDLAALGVDPGPPPRRAAPDVLRIEVQHPESGLTLLVDRDGAVHGGEGPVAATLLPVAAGMRVAGPDGEGLVLATHEAGLAWVRGAETELVAGPIANPRQLRIPFVVAWLVFGASFFTLRMAFVNLRLFGHAIAVTAGRYDHAGDEGEISHFQALSSALSATVGLGNIAGVAIAVSIGGPGAVFWMVVAGFLGMSSKFTECSLGQMYREVRPDGTVSGGPMHYLSRGVSEVLSDGPLRPAANAIAYPLGALFAVMCIGGSFGGGNMFQANQSFAAVGQMVAGIEPSMATPSAQFALSVVYGIALAVVVGAVILGGIKRIGSAAGVIVPLMVGVYMLAGLGVLAVNAEAVPSALLHIVGEAFDPRAGLGGVMGVLIVGFQRAAFSNEAGVGSASIAHSAATTAEPVREGIVALLEPFIDTIVVCTMTGLVVVVTGAYQAETGDGVLMTSFAFATVFSWFPYVLTVAVVLFAFSTMISWSYYGERCSVWLFGEWARVPYKLVFLVFVVLGSVFKLGSVLDFSDLMILGMAVPNIVGLLILSGRVRRALDQYVARLRAGLFTRA